MELGLQNTSLEQTHGYTAKPMVIDIISLVRETKIYMPTKYMLNEA